MSDTARVLAAQDYAVGAQPYLLERVAAAAIEELRRKRTAKGAPEAPKVDPEAVRLRAEAGELKAQAERLLKDAQARAAALLEEAKAKGAAEAATARETARREGMESGRAAGLEEGRQTGHREGLARYGASVEAFEGLLREALAQKEAYFTDREAMLVELAVRVAAKVIHGEVRAHKDLVLDLLRQTARMLTERSKLVVTLHPASLERITQAQSDGLLKIQGVKQLEFLADDKILEGGLRVTSGALTLDATLDSQLAELCRGLLEEAAHEL